MKVATIFKYHFTFEYWTLQADTTGTTSYVKKSDGVGMMVPTGGRDTFALITDEPMDVPMQVRNLRDRSGKVITEVGGTAYPMYVISAEPQLDPFSNVIAYRHTLSRKIPREYEDFFADLSDLGGAL